MTKHTNLQVLREIDKLDKIGEAGVRAMLTDGMKDASGAFNAGIGLHPAQAEFILACISGASDPLKRITMLCDRFAFMAKLEETVVDEKTGETAWDRLLNMPRNDNESWDNGGRPANIGWALDDLVVAMRRTASAASSGVGRDDT